MLYCIVHFVTMLQLTQPLCAAVEAACLMLASLAAADPRLIIGNMCGNDLQMTVWQ